MREREGEKDSESESESTSMGHMPSIAVRSNICVFVLRVPDYMPMWSGRDRY